MARTISAVLLLALFAVPVSGQIAWESPALVSPAVPAGLSLFVMDPAGGDLGALGTYRHSAGPVGLGFRAALAEDAGDDLAIAGGIDVSGFLARGVEGSEVDVIWWTGGGLGIGDEVLVTAPLGLIIGWTGTGGDVVLSPYGGAHLVLDFYSGLGDDVDLDGVFDLGLDLGLPSGWIIRFGATLGDRDSLALGFKLPGLGS